jgi:hypothetical protein
MRAECIILQIREIIGMHLFEKGCLNALEWNEKGAKNKAPDLPVA